MPSFTVQLSSLWFVATQAIYNLDDNSAFLSLSAEYNIAQNFYMDFGYYHFSGDEFSLTEDATTRVQTQNTALTLVHFFCQYQVLFLNLGDID